MSRTPRPSWRSTALTAAGLALALVGCAPAGASTADGRMQSADCGATGSACVAVAAAVVRPSTHAQPHSSPDPVPHVAVPRPRITIPIPRITVPTPRLGLPRVGAGIGYAIRVHLSVRYDLPVGTKIEWFYNLNPDAGNCLASWAPNWSDVVATTGETRTVAPLMVTPRANQSFSCQFERSYGTWQVRITAPGKTPRTGSIYVRTGVPNPITSSVETSCHDFAADVTCGGDSTTEYGDGAKAEDGADILTVGLTLGPIR